MYFFIITYELTKKYFNSFRKNVEDSTDDHVLKKQKHSRATGVTQKLDILNTSTTDDPAGNNVSIELINSENNQTTFSIDDESSVIQSKSQELDSKINKSDSLVQQLQHKIKVLINRQAKHFKKLKELTSELQKKDTEINKWKQKYYRLLRKTNGTSSNDKILEKVKEIEKSGSEEIHKKLIYGEVLKKQINDKMNTLGSKREKSILKQCLAGKIVKKYKTITKTSGLVSEYIQKKYSDSKSIVVNISKAKKEKKNL